MNETENITRLLDAVEAGRSGAMDALMDAVYADLERMARAVLRRQFGAHAQAVTLEPAALVNESFMKLIRQRKGFDNRGQFFSIATRIMLRVLIDYRRERGAAKRGAGHDRITLAMADRQVGDQATETELVDVEELAAAMDRLEAFDGRKADVVKMRVVWGMGVDEVAAALGTSASTIERDWRFAKSWLLDQIESGDSTVFDEG